MMSALVCPQGERLSRATAPPPRPRDRATSAPHGIARFRRRTIGRKHRRWRAGGVERSPPGDGLAQSPGKEGIPGKRHVSNIFWRRFLPGFFAGWEDFRHFRRRCPPGFFRVPCLLVVPLFGRCVFLADGTLSSPTPWDFFPLSPGISAQRYSARLCMHKSNGSRLACIFIFIFFAFSYGF